MKRVAAGVAGLLLLVALWLWPLWRGPGAQPLAPRDVALAPRDLPAPLRIAVLGTSLSHDEPWTGRLADALSACLGPTEITVIARPGAGVEWGQRQVETVARAAPDLVLVEFAVNDADIRDGLPRPEADAATRALFDSLAAALPDAALVEMTMSPASGLRGVLRPDLGDRYGDVLRRAGEGAAPGRRGAVDLHARWLALPRDARGLEDGLHPDPAVAETVIVPPLRDYIAAAYSAACAVSDNS